MLEMIQMLHRYDRSDFPPKQPRLRQRRLPRRIVRQIRRDQRNDPAPHDHQHRIHRENRRPPQRHNAKSQPRQHQKNLNDHDRMRSPMPLRRPNHDPRLKNYSLRQRPHQRHLRRLSFDVIVMRKSRMVMQMRQPISMSRPERHQLDSAQKKIIPPPRQPQRAMYQIMRS